MRTAVVGPGILLGAACGGTAQADPYRWCAEYGEGTNCHIVTLQHCHRQDTSYTGPDRRRADYGMDVGW